MEQPRNNPFDREYAATETDTEVNVSQMKEWVSNKLKELEDQNFHLKEENRKFNEELSRLKEIYVNKSFTPEVHRKHFPKRDNYGVRPSSRLKKYTSSNNVGSSSSDDEFFVNKAKYQQNFLQLSKAREEKISQPKIEGENITLLSGTSRRIYTSNRAGSLDRKLTRMKRLNFNQTCKKASKPNKREHFDIAQRRERSLDLEKDASGKPPTPPLHRCPSWESRIYEIANNGIKSAISTPVQQVKHFEHSNNQSANVAATDSTSYIDTFRNESAALPIFKNNNGRLTKVRLNSFEESMSSDFEGFTLAKSSTTSSGNESDFGNEMRMYAVANDNDDSDSSQDYAYPPDALCVPVQSLRVVDDTPARSPVSIKKCLPTGEPNTVPKLSAEHKFEKCGYLLKLSGRFKTWKRRWFVVKEGLLVYYKKQEDCVKQKPKAEIALDQSCKLIRAKECRFHISYKDGKKSLNLSADCEESYNEWIRVITHALNYHNIVKIQANQAPIIANYLIKARFGRSLKCWAALYGHHLVYFSNSNEKMPFGFTDLKNCTIQQMDTLDNFDDTVFVYDDTKRIIHNSISIHAHDNSEPIYLLFFSKQDFNLWHYHVSLATSEQQTCKTSFENYLSLLSSIESSVCNRDEFYRHQAWNNSAIIFTNENIVEPLTSLSGETLKNEAIKLFKSIQLFISVPIDMTAIDYHVSLIQNSLKVAFLYPDLQHELFYQLIKQSTPEEKCKEFLRDRKNAIHMFLCASHTIFDCDPQSASEKSSSSSFDLTQTNESNVKKFSTIFLQCFQFLAVTISIFEPKNRVLWLLRHHLNRSKDTDSEVGKYAIYCERALQRVLANGGRKQIPSRMEVLSILQRNPYKHSMPHSIPVHFSNSSYQVFGFDGSSTVAEFMQLINAESGIRDNLYSGFALFSDDPIDESFEHLLQPSYKLADIISYWESNLRKYHLGKFESTKAAKLIYKHRLCLKRYFRNETDKERILWVYDINASILSGKFPILFDLAIELMALLLQIEFGDLSSTQQNLDSVYQRSLLRFLPLKFQNVPTLKQTILDKWSELEGRSTLDCVRIYLNCTRRYTNLCGSAVFEAKASNSFKYDDLTSMQLCKIFSQFPYIWIVVCEDMIELLEVDSFRSILRIPYTSIMNFGGHKSHFMLMVNGNMLEKLVPDSNASVPFTEANSRHGQRLLFSMPRKMIIDITMLLADYINLISLSSNEP